MKVWGSSRKCLVVSQRQRMKQSIYFFKSLFFSKDTVAGCACIYARTNVCIRTFIRFLEVELRVAVKTFLGSSEPRPAPPSLTLGQQFTGFALKLSREKQKGSTAPHGLLQEKWAQCGASQELDIFHQGNLREQHRFWFCGACTALLRTQVRKPCSFSVLFE